MEFLSSFNLPNKATPKPEQYVVSETLGAVGLESSVFQESNFHRRPVVQTPSENGKG